MSNIREAIRDRLLAVEQVSSITERIRPGVLTSGDKPPAILVKVVANIPQEWLNDSTRIYKARVAVQAYGKDAGKADALAKLIRDYGLPSMLKGIFSGQNIREVSLEAGPFDDEDQPIDGSDDWLRHVRQDFQVIYYPQGA